MGLFFRKSLSSSPVSAESALELSECETIDHMQAISKIYNARMEFEYRSKKVSRRKKVPMCNLWDSPESLIVNAVELVEVLKADGLSEKESIARLLSFSAEGETAEDLLSYLQIRLDSVEPSYRLLGQVFLEKAIHIAKAAAVYEISKRSRMSEVIPSGNLIRRYSFSEVEAGLIENEERGKGLQFYSPVPCPDFDIYRDWQRLRLRMKEGDEVLLYLRSYHGFAIEAAFLSREGSILEYSVGEMPMITLKI